MEPDFEVPVSWGSLGAVLGPLGVLLEPLGGRLVSSWGALGTLLASAGSLGSLLGLISKSYMGRRALLGHGVLGRRQRQGGGGVTEAVQRCPGLEALRRSRHRPGTAGEDYDFTPRALFLRKNQLRRSAYTFRWLGEIGRRDSEVTYAWARRRRVAVDSPPLFEGDDEPPPSVRLGGRQDGVL